MMVPGTLRVLAVAAPLALVGVTAGQVGSVAPYFAVVTSDDAMMRCGNEDNFYPIAKLAKGQVLRVDGEGGGWSRVGYPAGIAAFIPADSFQPDSGGKSGAVTKGTRLKALNMTTGLKGSWAPVLETPAPVGTKLTIVDTEAAADGRGNTAYKIAPPEGARAYVPSAALRKATSDEVNAAASKPVEESSKPALGNVGTQPTPPAAAPGAKAPTPAPTSGPGAPATTHEKQPATVPQDPASKALETKPVEIQVKPPAPIPPSPYEKLESAFESVRKQPTETAEFSELQAEFQAAVDKLENTPANQQVRARLVQRLEYLKLYSDIQAQRRKLLESQQQIGSSDAAIKQRMADLDRVRQYTLVGRLSASTIYDGKRLPLMYRVQTVGGPAPRTLAYVKPDPKLGIDGKLGQVVGVLGDSVVDPTLRINIITPIRVDALEPAEATPAPTEAPSKPSAAAPEAASKPSATAPDGNK